eukprot:TRINITY_DN9626_c0_g1_i1.p1 TRINITY_DN9626_c0_g1~~TRINITY_DN9626_c0_g1_i1.p1  ORF type:complete len:317 (-),score=83.94 TRINITY_DN9626_c0_g1_i1:63-1013(-)
MSQAHAISESHGTEEFCARWEAWSADITVAVAAGSSLPAPPPTPPDVAWAAARIAEAAMAALAALWTSEEEARKLRSQIQDLQHGVSLGFGYETSSGLRFPQGLEHALHEEKVEVQRLRAREADLSEKVAAARAESRRLRERDSEFAEAHVQSQAAILQAKKRETMAKLEQQEKEHELHQLRQQAAEASSQLGQQESHHQERLTGLQRRLHDSESERRRLKADLQTSELRRLALLTELKELADGYADVAEDHLQLQTGIDGPYGRERHTAATSRKGSPTTKHRPLEPSNTCCFSDGLITEALAPYMKTKPKHTIIR